MYKHFDWRIESVSLLILFLQLYFVINIANSLFLFPFIISCSVYFLLSVVLYYSVSPKIVFKSNSSTEYYGEKIVLNETEKLNYFKTAISFVSLFKLCLLLIPAQLYFKDILSIQGIFINILFVVILLFSACFLLLLSINNFIKARGFTTVSLKNIFNNGLMYNNPNDNRAIVDKPFGIGSTVNLASKEGRVILWVILAIPITIITLLFVVFALAGQL